MMGKKNVAKYSKLCATVELILLAFPNLYTVKSGFNHVHYLLSKYKSTLNTECGDLWLKLKN